MRVHVGLRLICMPYMHALYVCRECMPCMYALYVCLVCMPYMYAVYVCLDTVTGGAVLYLTSKYKITAADAN